MCQSVPFMLDSPVLFYTIAKHISDGVLIQGCRLFLSLITVSDLLQVQAPCVGAAKQLTEVRYLTEDMENWNPAGDLTKSLEGWQNAERGSNSFQRPSMDCLNLLQYKGQNTRSILNCGGLIKTTETIDKPGH